VVPAGRARAEAEALAGRIAAFPQAAMLGDRMSAYEQHGRELADALANELRRGAPALEEAVEGAGRFSAGAGRHGSFED
jgi:enoyl-CoA hydratase